MKKTMKGFTLVELIIVIAIIGILSAIIIPNAVNHVKEAQKTVDVQNARMIAEAVDLVLLTDDKANETFYLSKGFSRDSIGVTCITTGGGLEKYEVYVIARSDGTTKPKAYEGYSWNPSDSKLDYFADALNEKMGFPPKYAKPSTYKKPCIPIKCIKHTDSKEVFGGKAAGVASSMSSNLTDRWYIVYRKDNPDRVEIWVGDSYGGWKNGLAYRLYPNPDDEYIVTK